MTAPFVISTKWDTCLEWITKWHYPELRGYFTLKSRKHSQLSLKCSRVRIEMDYEKFKRNDRPDRFRSLTLLSTIFSPLLGESLSLFTLGSARAVLVVALVYSFPDVFNVIMALIFPYTNQPFIVPIRRTSIIMSVGYSFQTSISLCWNNKQCFHFLLYKQLLTFPVIF
jgi:hypothetical protein